MRFSVNRLCGGKALMMSSVDVLDIDMGVALEVLSSIGKVTQNDDLMIVMEWNGMEVTFYPQGKIMFHPLENTEEATHYATDILNRMIDSEQ